MELDTIVVAAAEFEAQRQAYMYSQGNPTSQETRTFDVATGKTVVTRNKEGSVDYRFMPEPVSFHPVLVCRPKNSNLTL